MRFEFFACTVTYADLAICHQDLPLPFVRFAEAYRRAVELNPRDYRAWYGLGQTYELLRMPFYALYYFRRATQLRPHDARMWCAMGQCYENDQLQSVDKDKMEVAAIRCYRRAVQNGDREGIALHKLVNIVSLHLDCMLELVIHCTTSVHVQVRLLVVQRGQAP